MIGSWQSKFCISNFNDEIYLRKRECEILYIKLGNLGISLCLMKGNIGNSSPVKKKGKKKEEKKIWLIRTNAVSVLYLAIFTPRSSSSYFLLLLLFLSLIFFLLSFLAMPIALHCWSFLQQQNHTNASWVGAGGLAAKRWVVQLHGDPWWK